MASASHNPHLRITGTVTGSLLRSAPRTILGSLLALASLPTLSIAEETGPDTGEETAAQTVQSLRYGASLYHYYQQDYFGALTELTAGQQLDDLGPHTDGAELLRGGMTLSWGMDREAENIFIEQLRQPRNSLDADQAWFYLGKLAWQRGDVPRAYSSLARMDSTYDGTLREEATYLRANADLRLGDIDSANAQLQHLEEQSHWHSYLAYNLGANRAAGGDWQGATDYFSGITAYEAESLERYALRDKSLTATGYAYLAGGQPEFSAIAFEQVRLDSPYSNRALLGYGWSFAVRGDYLQALSPWQQLAERSALEESARDSLLAVPYAYEQLGRPGLALEKYQFASDRYAAEISGVSQAIDAFRDEPLAPLLGITEESSADWLFDTGILPDNAHSPYLQHLVTQHSFQVALKELRDLYSIAGHLSRAQERLQVLQEVDHHQQETWSSILEQDRRNALAQQETMLAMTVHELQIRIAQAIDSGDSRQLADSKQTGRWARLEKTAQLANALDAEHQQQEKLRLLRGLMIWDDNEQFAARAWQARKQLREVDALAAQSTLALERVGEAIGNRQQSDFAPRIATLSERVQQQAGDVALTIAQSENALRHIAINELERQAQQLARAQGQSQLAIAQIHDRARQVP